MLTLYNITMAMSAFESEYNPFAQLEAEEVLRKSREGVVQLAYGRLDEAMQREAEGGNVYFWHDDAEVADSDLLAIMLTRDGVYPFIDELDEKEQIILRFSSDSLDTVTVEHVRDGERNTFVLNADQFTVVGGQAAQDSTEVEPSEADIQLVINKPEVPVSDMARISHLREKIERFELAQRP